MKKLAIAIAMLVVALTGSIAQASGKPVTMVWYPNESGDDLKSSREEIGKLVETATGRKVVHKTTTDYVIAIEAIANNQAHMGFYGAEGYVEAHRKNAKVVPLVTNSGSSGTLADAKYFSWLSVKYGNEGMYKTGGKYSMDNLEGKRFSFVSTSSTSGFKVPSTGIAKYFSAKAKWKDLKGNDLLEGGQGKLFSSVLFGNSHQGSAVNLLTGKADAAAFCDTCVANYVELDSGTENMPGAVYRVRKNAADPFTALMGEKFTVISVTPVINGPFAINTGLFTARELAKLKELFTSDATAANSAIFVPKGTKGLGFAVGQKFLEVQDAWYEPIRALSK